jgi:hypothetical protein
LNNLGSTLLKLHGDYLPRALQAAFPDHNWRMWLFCNGTRAPTGFWKDSKNQRQYVDWLGAHLGIQQMEGWYQVTYEIVSKNHGNAILMEHKYSLIKMLSSVYPDHVWHPWLFRQVPAGFWEVRENVVQYVEWLGDQLGVKQPEHWYDVTVEDFKRHSGTYQYFPRFYFEVVEQMTFFFFFHRLTSKFSMQGSLLCNETATILDWYSKWCIQTTNGTVGRFPPRG